MSNSITCPKCKCEIEVAEVLAAQLRVELRGEFEAEKRKQEAELQAKWDAERKQLSAEAERKAAARVAVDVQDMQSQLAEAKAPLKTSQQTELELRKQRQALEAEKEAFELTLNRTLDEERSKIKDKAKQEAVEERRLKDAEKDKLISDLGTQVEDLKRKLEQGSQQTQGEVLEIQIETVLQRQFPHDTITPVPKGVHGGDALQTVHDANGGDCGSILWESKRTKSWSDGWLPKLRNDQRTAKAQFAILVSMEMPKGTSTFNCIDNVWVTSWPCAIGLAIALRSGLIELAAAKRSLDGKQDKMELLYNYLSGPEFRHRVEGIVEAFVTLRNDLEAEKRALQRIWAKREKQLDQAVTNTVGMYGDLGGIIGGSLPRIESLELPAITLSDGESEST
jgi:hypothetical protein